MSAGHHTDSKVLHSMGPHYGSRQQPLTSKHIQAVAVIFSDNDKHCTARCRGSISTSLTESTNVTIYLLRYAQVTNHNNDSQVDTLSSFSLCPYCSIGFLHYYLLTR